jgi:hypothetical protein
LPELASLVHLRDGEAFVGYISSFAAQIEDPNGARLPKFVLSTVHPDWVTLAEGYFETVLHQPPVVPLKEGGRDARPPLIGIGTPATLWHYFTTPGPYPNSQSMWVYADEYPARGDPQPPKITIDHTETLYLSLFEGETPHSSILGLLAMPVGEISIRSLTVKDLQSKGIVLYGLAANGAAVSILIQPSPPWSPVHHR